MHPRVPFRDDVRRLLEFLALAALPVLVFFFLAMAAWGHDGGYHWREWREDPGRLYLFHGGEQVGAYDLDECYYRPYDARTATWGPAGEAPVPPRPMPAVPANHGVEAPRISQRETYRLNGQPVTRQQAAQALQRGAVPDDARRLRLTIIGTAAERDRVLRDLAQAPALAALAPTLVVQDYDPGDWTARDAGFVARGRPTIYLQLPDGTVLHRQDD